MLPFELGTSFFFALGLASLALLHSGTQFINYLLPCMQSPILIIFELKVDCPMGLPSAMHPLFRNLTIYIKSRM